MKHCLRPGCEQPFSPAAMFNPATTLKSKSHIFIFRKKNNSFNCIASEKSWFSKRINVRYQWPAQLHRQVGLTFLPPRSRDWLSRSQLKLTSTSTLPHLCCVRCLQAMAEDCPIVQPQTTDVDGGSVEVLHRFQICLKEQIIVNSAFMGVTQLALFPRPPFHMFKSHRYYFLLSFNISLP